MRFCTLGFFYSEERHLVVHNFLPDIQIGGTFSSSFIRNQVFSLPITLRKEKKRVRWLTRRSPLRKGKSTINTTLVKKWWYQKIILLW